MLSRSIIIALLCAASACLSAQRPEIIRDTTQDLTVNTGATAAAPVEKAKLFSGRPGKAALYSLVLPGAGQVYNKKYWKLPLVYGAIGGSIGLLSFNGKQFKVLTNDINESLRGEYTGTLSLDQLQRLRREARKNQQISGVILGVAWLLNSVDAFVDAHLSTFDVSEDLSGLSPMIRSDIDLMNSAPVVHIGLSYSF